MKSRARTILLVILAMLMVFLAQSAWAKTSYMYISSSNNAPVNLRSGPGRDYRVVLSLETGCRVEVLGQDGEWTQVRVDETEGYVMTLFLSEKDPLEEAGLKEAYIQSTNSMPVNLRAGAGRNQKIIGTLVTGTQVTVIGESGEWSEIQVTGTDTTGYVLTSFLTPRNPYGSSESGKHTGKTVYIGSENGGSVNVRETASSDGTIVTRVPTWTEATLITPGSIWTKVQVDGATGFVRTEYVSTSPVKGDVEDDGDETKIMFVQSTDSWPVNLREGRGRGTRIIETLVTGTQVTVLSSDANWSKVTVGGKTGYIMNMYLVSKIPSSAMTEKSYTAYVKTENHGTVRMRNGAGMGYGVVTVLDFGTEVRVLSEIKDWARVRCGQFEGYISLKYLSTTKPE